MRAGSARERLPGLLALAIPLLVATLHGATFGDWIVDDAGISFAYARNLAAGHGLVAQPGVAPVEGYSNFLWVLLLTPAYALGLFHPVWTPKVLGLLGLGAAFALLHRALAVSPAWGALAALVAFSLTALQPAVAAWVVSGLENGLLACVVAGLLERTLAARADGGRPRAALAAGGLAVAAALTRPDGILYAGAPPLLLLLGPPAPGGRRTAGRLVAWYALGLFPLLGGFLMFRVAYFGDLLPNPYYAKGGPTVQDLLALLGAAPRMRAKLAGLLGAAAGPGAVAVGAGLVLATAAVAWARRLDVGHLALTLWLLHAALAYLLLPPDWMAEHRFATPFFLLLYADAALLLRALLELSRGVGVRREVTFAALGALLLLATAALAAPRSRRFAERPPLPLHVVAEVLGHRLNRFVAAFGLEPTSILLSDVGGTLLVSRLRVYDLHGLCDPVIARTLGHGRDLRAFHDYVFGRIRPGVIHLATPEWARITRLDADPRFARDYARLEELVGPEAPRRFGLDAYPGQLYLRRDLALRPNGAGGPRRPRRRLRRARADAGRPARTRAPGPFPCRPRSGRTGRGPYAKPACRPDESRTRR